MNRREFTAAFAVGLLGASTAVARRFAPVSLADPWDLPAEYLNTERVLDTGHTLVEHWRIGQNGTWRWFEKSELTKGIWRHTGMTMPVHRRDGFQVSGRDCADYLLMSEVPEPVIAAAEAGSADICIAREGASPGPAVSSLRKARDGRPPSRWVRDLDADQLHLWLATFEPPRADVAGMTFFEHLTRDHGFSSHAVATLTLAEQAKLHGAAHGGF